MFAPLARKLEAGAHDAFDLGCAIDHRVNRDLDAVVIQPRLLLTEINAAGQLAHHDEIEPAHQFRSK